MLAQDQEAQSSSSVPMTQTNPPFWQAQPGHSQQRMARDALLRAIAAKPDEVRVRDWVSGTHVARMSVFTMHAYGMDPEAIMAEVANPDLTADAITKALTLCIALDFQHILILMKGIK